MKMATLPVVFQEMFLVERRWHPSRREQRAGGGECPGQWFLGVVQRKPSSVRKEPKPKSD